MRRFLSQRLDHPFDEPVSQNSVKLRLNNIALGNFLADEDHDVLPSRSIKITLAAECMDRNERQVRNSFYTALHSIVDRASLSNISLEVSDSYAGSKSWTPRYHEGHVLNLRRCFRDTFKNDNAFYFYMMWLSDYGELELPTRISCQLLDEVRQSLPSMLEQEQRLHRMLLLAYTTDVQHPGYVRLVCPHEVTVSFQEYDQMIQNAWAAIIAITFHSNIPDSGDHPILQLRSLLKSRLHIEHDEIRSLDSNGTHTRFIYRVFSEEETAERHKKMQNDLRSLNETKRPSYHETKEHVEELSDKDVSRFFCEGIPFGSVKKRVRSESMQRYEILLRDMINVFGSKSITFCATNNESITAVQEIVHADFQLYVTLVIHAVSCIASESVYRSLSLHWKENTRLLHNRISFSCRRNTLRDLTDGIIKHIFNPNKEVQSSLSLKILLSGPPGSGKSTFLATAAHILSKHMNKRSVVMVRHIKADSQCKTVVGLLASISSQIALLVPGASTHAQMSAKEHLESISACVIRLCTSNAKFTRDEEHIRFVLLIDDMDILESDAVELLDSWIPVGFHPNFSIIATSSLEFSDRKLIFLRNSGLKLDHVIQIPPFDATLLSDLIDSTATKTDADLQEPIEDMSTIMANTGVFTTKSAPSSRPQTSASVSISLYSENHELKANRTFTDVDICQSIAHEADEFAESSCSDKDSFTIDATMHNILVCATEFNSFELAVEYLRSSSLSAIPKQISTVSFIQKILGSASEEFGVVFVSHIMAYITFSRDCIERSELLALLTSDEEVLAEARNKHYDLYSGSTTIKYPASIINSFLETCILLKIILRRNEDTLRCNCSLLIAAWCCSQHGFDHKFIHSNMAMYFLGSWKCEGLPSQPLEKLLHPAPAQINRRRIREGPYHAILAEEFTLAGQEVARYSYLDTCYRHGQGHEAAYYLKLLAGYIHSDSSKFNDMDLQQRINDYWIFVHCNHQKICVNAQLLYSLACATNPSSSCFDDATLNPQQATQWSSSTIGFRLPRNSSIENLRCCRNLPHIEGTARKKYYS
jgi:energy-coupling factor transporter ATP-binding protein EcfA2